MKKMIGVINDNLRNVINGIKTHRIEAEKNLAVIISEIDEKVGIAGHYKQSVEDARSIISSLENEISELERDLTELNDKFGAKNFKEILAAGNKEISTKIIEKRSLISDQSRVISELTEQAHALKEVLLKLKEKKNATEQLLNKSMMLETYYEVRISDIINYSEENPDSLDQYIDENAHKIINVNKLAVSDIDLDETVDESIFEEIDSISSSSEVAEKIMEAIEDITEGEDSDNGGKYIDLTVTQQLDDVILAASSIIAKEKEEENTKVEPPVDSVFEQLGDIDNLSLTDEKDEEDEESSGEELNEKVEEEEVAEDSIEDQNNLENLFFDDEESNEEIPEREEHYPVFEESIFNDQSEEEYKVELREVEEDATDEVTEEDEEETEVPLEPSEEEFEINITDIEEPVEEERFNFTSDDNSSDEEEDDENEKREYTLDDFLGPNLNKEDEEEIEEETQEISVIDDLLMETADASLLFGNDNEEPIIKEEIKEEEELPIIEEEKEELPVIDDKKEDVRPIVINAALDINQIKDKLFAAASQDFYSSLEECGLSYDRFSEDDLILFESFFNKENTQSFIQILKKHNIAVDVIYEHLNVLMNVTPQNLDKIISLIKVTGATSEAITYIFGKLDRVNINDLERAININSNRQMIEVLYEAVPYNGEEELVKALDLSQSDEMAFRNNTTIDEFKMMNLFPEVVLANYKELKKLNIDNLTECIVKHPRRFGFNPDRFVAILDKYDTEDLIRCINKNSAVIDRL